MRAMSWSAEQYLAFEAERTRPVRDLLAAVPPAAATKPIAKVIDLGCGPGNSTEVLARRFRDADVSGLDSSADMIEAARRRLPHLRFDCTDIESWAYHPTAERFDVILANAVLQWLPNHARLLPALLHRLTAGGALAVQVPDNFHEPSHVLMRDLAADGPWAARLQGVRGRADIATADWYYATLRSAGGKADIWRTTYHHPLAGGAGAIVEWFKGSGLRPYLAALDPAESAEFLSRYESALARAYPAAADGLVLLPFPRLFLVASR
jgi:trans-aconitate 2-methyltransferase